MGLHPGGDVEGVEVVLGHINPHTAISEGNSVQRHLPSKHWVDVDNNTRQSAQVGVGMVLHVLVHLELGLISHDLHEIRQGLLLLEVNVEGEGELVFKAQGMLHPVPLDVLNGA